MAVDLEDLIPSLKAEMSPPGSDLFPNATAADLLQRLQNAFWEARLSGAFPTYREADGLVSPISGTDDLPREMQQLIVIFAAYNVVLTELRNAQSMFRAQAGPVEFEQQRSAPLLRAVLDGIKQRLAWALDAAINGVGSVGNTSVFDAVIARTESIGAGNTWHVN